jgi:hypothetical protein
MNNKYLHLFIYLDNKSDDKYFGIKKQLSDQSHLLENIVFSDISQAIFNKVEYSNRKLLREFFYKDVFKELETKIISRIESNKNSRHMFIYTLDEGVWSEFIRFLIKKYKINDVKFINVQHGFLFNRKNNPLRTKIIKLINNFYTTFFGFPKFGIGPFHGPFDHYLLFYDEQKDYVIPGTKSISCPNLINRLFIDKFLEIKNNTYDKKSVLIALQYFDGVIYGATETFDFEKTLLGIKPLIKTLNINFKYKVFLRRHPNMDKNKFSKMLSKVNLEKYITVDTLPLNESIYRSPLIFSLFSTILFEAKLVSRTPVVIDNKSFDMNLFPVKYQSIDLDKDITQQFKKILNSNKEIRNYNDEINWKEIVESYFD